MNTHVGPAVRRVSPALAATLLVMTLAACNLLGNGYQLDQERGQARAALQRWDAAAAAASDQALVVVGDLTGQIGNWEEAVGDNKLALIAGKVEAAVALPTETPPPAVVRWDDGSTRTLPVISAAQAVEDIKASGEQACPDCDALAITGATLTSVEVETNRGPARAPAWDFTLQGTAVDLTRVAVAAGARITVTPPDPSQSAVGLSIESASGSADSRELTVSFTGAPDPASKPCGADYSGEAVESTTAVVVIVIESSNPQIGACSAVGATRTATVQLASPLGNRAVLDVRQGLPVPVTLTPTP